MEWLKNRAVKLVGGLKARDWRELQVYFGKLFLEIRSNVERKGCRISSGAVTVKLIPGSSLYNYYISLSDPTQAPKYSGITMKFMCKKIYLGIILQAGRRTHITEVYPQLTHCPGTLEFLVESL